MGERSIEPAPALTCWGLPFVGEDAIEPARASRTRRRLRDERRWLRARRGGLWLATAMANVASVWFAVVAVGPDGTRMHPIAAVLIGLLIGVLAGGVCCSVIAIACAPRRWQRGINALVLLIVVVAAAFDVPEWVTGAALVGGFAVGLTGFVQLLDVITVEVSSSQIVAALADLDRGLAWRFQGLLGDDEAVPAPESDPTAILYDVEVLPTSALVLTCQDDEPPRATMASLRPVLDHAHDPFGRVEHRAMLPAERLEVGAVLRQHLRVTVFETLGALWLLPSLIAGIGGALGLSDRALGFAALGGAALALVPLVRRLRQRGRLRLDLRDGVVERARAPAASCCREVLPHSGLSWTPAGPDAS